jgi:hypothetical protein
VDPEEDDVRFIAWMYKGDYYIDPLSQFEFDDDYAKASVSTPWPITYILAKWRPVYLDWWRRLRGK